MGIAPAFVLYLLKEHRRRPFGGRVLTLGRQGVWVTRPQLAELFERAGVAMSPVDDAVWNAKPCVEGLPDGMISDGALFSAFGCDAVHAMDVSDYEAADIVHDLNQPVPSELEGRYDLIIDGGTFEHVFDQRTAFANVVRMLRVGGRVVHAAPTSNYVDHGFYSLNPTLFLDFYLTNGLEINRVNLFEHSRAHDSEPWTVYAYPFESDRYSFGGLGTPNLWGTFCVATRLEGSRADLVPSQGAHARLLVGGDAPAWTGAGWQTRVERSVLLERFGDADAPAAPQRPAAPRIRHLVRRLADRWRRRGTRVPLDVVDRF